MSLRQLIELHQFLFTLESQAAQRLAWEDAEQARIRAGAGGGNRRHAPPRHARCEPERPARGRAAQ